MRRAPSLLPSAKPKAPAPSFPGPVGAPLPSLADIQAATGLALGAPPKALGAPPKAPKPAKLNAPLGVPGGKGTGGGSVAKRKGMTKR